ncbi:alpha-glucan family phosphorylase [Thiobacillus sedimenti]|uniref:Alpha-glucan family phosphorylase n=1 Tax=Thiobacillus sedimenti TaxID=3110231 RepID=A0ABZ1CR93_9PROT|nr:alpha-glucan family phosphorylase [Thiobacillus sp. SCUT-2]WRS40443.1 alpha-glucan family phosphorylase [Thiobacillus sp. SCUT-2]
MPCPPATPLFPLPDALAALGELALDLRWSWSHATDVLWERIDPALWRQTHNPWLILQNASVERLRELAADGNYLATLAELAAAHRDVLARPAWFQTACPPSALQRVAYFSMEFGLSESLPIYSGGLGILAGDFLKTASDLGVPVVGIGLLWQQGYFRQSLDEHGNQVEFFPHNEPAQLPVLPVYDANGERLRIELPFPGRTLILRAWQVRVGRVSLYLLDSNDPLNTPADRGVTAELYGGGSEMRLLQELCLGVGGWQLLRRLDIRPEVCHLNEGHAAFVVLARAWSHMRDHGSDFRCALNATRAGNVFTTHTPVAVGFDRFTPELLQRYTEAAMQAFGLDARTLLALGRANPDDASEPFNMAYLAMRGSILVNAVSHLHGHVSRRIFQPLFPRWPQEDVPVGHITNGVHVPSWDSAEADRIWTDACGKARWLGELEHQEEQIRDVSDPTLWALRTTARQRLIAFVREHLQRQLATVNAPAERIAQAAHALDPNALTLGFARRFAAYKRPNMLLADPERLVRILTNSHHPVQLVIAGKAHPRDQAGKAMIRQWNDFIASRPELAGRVVFLADYDMLVAEQMVQGVDLWINTPRRPWEACGTSGMKILVNGGLNLSELDGWWAKAYAPELGWALGDGREHDNDPAWDAAEAAELYRMLEEDVIPLFYHDRDAEGCPRGWVAKMRASMSLLTPRFSSNRMLREYVEHLYLPAAACYAARQDPALGRRLCDWQDALARHWERLHFGEMRIDGDAGAWNFSVPVYLDDLDPDFVAVELYAAPPDAGHPEIHRMQRGDPLGGAVNSYTYRIAIPAGRAAGDYTPRIVPAIEGARVPAEASHILWYR